MQPLSAVEQCNHCRSALEVLRRREIHGTEEVEPLNRECAHVIINYLCTLVDHKACRCLLKNPEAYFAMHSAIMDLIELASSLIATLNEDLISFVEMEGGSVATSGVKRENGSEEYSLSCDDSESMDLESSSGLIPPLSGEVKGFTLDDRREILNLLPFLLTDQFQFYVLYHKYHSAIPDRRLTQAREAFAHGFFDTSGFSPPFILTLQAVRENSLFDRIRECLHEAKPGTMPPQFASKLLNAAAALKRLTNDHTIYVKVYPIREAGMKFICELADEQSETLRDPFMRNCAEHLWLACREHLEETSTVDLNGLALIIKHFNSPYLAPRLTALTQLNMFINICTELVHTESSSIMEDPGAVVADYLSAHKVLPLLFGPNSHAELLKQCPNLLNFMALYGKISKEDLDCIWSAAQMKHCGRQVFDLLTLIIKGLDPQLLLHLYALLKALKPCDHNEMTLQLASYVTKMIWSYAMCRTPFTAVVNQQQLPRIASTPNNDGIFQNAQQQQQLLSPERVGGGGEPTKLNARMDASSGDSTQASTTGEGHGADSLCEELVDMEESGTKSSPKLVEEDESASKNSPPPLIASPVDGKSPGKRVQGHEDESEERPSVWPQPLQKRARVGVKVMPAETVQELQHLLKAKEETVGGDEHESPVDSSTTTTTESSHAADEPGASSSSDDQSVDVVEHRDQVQRLMQHHAKFPTAQCLPSPIQAGHNLTGSSGSGYRWAHADSTSILMERLVKEKDLSQRGYGDSDSDMSSDAVSSSDRMNDLDEDELELAEVANEADEKEFGPSQTGNRPIHSSPMTVEDLMDEEDGSSSILDAGLNMDTGGTYVSPPRIVDPSDSNVLKRTATRLQTHLLRQQIVAQQQLIHNQSRHVLTQLAPHAKTFWQGGKYLDLNELELALFDLSLVCAPGHTLLWDLVIEDYSAQVLPAVVEPPSNENNEQQQHPTPSHQQPNGDRLSTELLAFALQLLEDVVSWAPNVFIKKVFVRGCVERLRNHTSVPTVLSLLRKILASFRQTWRTPAAAMAAHRYRHSIRGVVEDMNPVLWADSELGLLTAFFDDLKYYRQTQPSGGDEAKSLIESELRARVEFLEYVFSIHGTPSNHQIAPDQLDTLWECLSFDSYGQELLHRWLLEQLKSQSQHALNTDLLHHVLRSKVVTCKPETLSNAGLAFLQAVLHESNTRSPGADGEVGISVCLPLIWSAAMRNNDTTVAMTAMTFISNYYVHTGGSAQKEIQFIDHCINHLRFACETMVNTQFAVSLTCIHRAILILRSHIDAFRRRHSFHLRMWELEGRGMKSHMQCVPHAALVDAMPTIRLTLQAPGVEGKTVLDVSTTDLLGHLRAEVTYWWKNVKKVPPIVPKPLLGRSIGSVARKAASTPAFVQEGNDGQVESRFPDMTPQDPYPSVSSSSSVANPHRPIAVTAPMIVDVPASSMHQESSSGFIPFTAELKAVNINVQEETSPDSAQTGQNGAQNPILGALLSSNGIVGGVQQSWNGQSGGDAGPLRLLCQGRELTTDLDEKSVLEIGLHDGSIIHVQAGGGHAVVGLKLHGTLTQGTILRDLSPGQVSTIRDKSFQSAPPPDPASMPMALLSTPGNWELLMNLIKLLIDKASSGTPDLATKCRTWSYRAWEVIQLLPTYPPCMDDLQNVLDSDVPSTEIEMENVQGRWKTLFDSSKLHYFLYSTQCLEMLGQMSEKFVALGGMKHLANVFLDRSLFPKSNGDWSEWEVECVTAILRIIYKFSMENEAVATAAGPAAAAAHGDQGSISVGHRMVTNRVIKSIQADMLVPTLDMSKFAGIDTSQLVNTILDLIGEYCTERSFFHMCGPVSRVRGLQCAFQLLIAILLNDNELRKSFHFGSDSNATWLKRVLLDCQDPNLRREVSLSLYRLCRGRTKSNGFVGRFLTPRLTDRLLALLKDAKDIVPIPNLSPDQFEPDQKSHQQRVGSSSSSIDGDFLGVANSVVALFVSNGSDYKEPHGMSPTNYFWLLTNLLETLLHQGVVENPAAMSEAAAVAEREMVTSEFTAEFDAVAAEIAKYLLERPFYESKHYLKVKVTTEIGGNNHQRRQERDQQQHQLTDAGLVGLLQTAVAIIRFNPAWKFSSEGLHFVQSIFDLIFALPTPKNGRHHPKCQSSQSRVAAYELLVEITKGCEDNYAILFKKLMQQNSKDSHDCYVWDYWPQDERRAPCGYVGLMNLGATCYMASAMQQLYMIPRFRAALLSARVTESSKHEAAFREMQRMFAFLLESERKAYNPRAFCKSYQMNHQPLNITEQKDMAEFFTDLISKLEEMSPDVKKVVKNLFCGVMSNNVVSLDCPHVSKTIEDFYTVRCQVADMKDLHESLSELTIGDMLEGDNMYTCSQCNKKVRAEKRACFQKLPRILCFNTMRYTFNMITMMKEKVNTHFSFPFRLNMSAYMEENLLPSHASGDETNDSTLWTMKSNSRCNEYELIGVTVHTGTADGGHYYSFIRDRSPPTDASSASNQTPRDPETDRWYSFNDADVRPWDPAQLAAECFGGELTRQQYDTVAEKYLDLSFEKTNSAYLLLYERVSTPSKPRASPDNKASNSEVVATKPTKSALHNHNKNYLIDLPEDVERWLSEDNVRFIQDLTFFDEAYFHFVWRICSQVPATLTSTNPSDITCQSAKLSLSFVLETLLHSKEKMSISQWMELILKDMSASHKACDWFLSRMGKNNSDWPGEILIGCPSKSCREVFQKLCTHAILTLHPKQEPIYLLPWKMGEPLDSVSADDVGSQSSIGRFIKRLLSLLHSPYGNVETRQLNEFFGLLLEFAKSRPRAITFLNLISTIQWLITFYSRRSNQDTNEPESEEDMSDEEMLPRNLMSLVNACGMRMQSSVWSPTVLERLLKLITLLLDKARASEEISASMLRTKDLASIIGGKGFPFLMQMIRDIGNPTVSGPLIMSVCSGNQTLGKRIIEAIFDHLKRLKEDTDHYLNLLSYFVDMAEKSVNLANTESADAGASSSVVAEFANLTALPYVHLILDRMWELAECKPVYALKWLEKNISNHRTIIFDSLIDDMQRWVERFLLKEANSHARVAAGELLLALIPSPTVRSSFSNIGKGINLNPRPAISSEAASVLHRVYEHLLFLLRERAHHYALLDQYGTHRLVQFFQTMKACLVSKDEKLMTVQYVGEIWNLFYTYMLEKPVKINANKQALLTFWFMACVDCPEMIQASVSNKGVHVSFMYNYIHVSDDDDDLTNSNKVMLSAFYGLMRLFCMYSPSFCDVVIRHENTFFACNSVAIKEAYRDPREEILSAIEICFKQCTIKPDDLLAFKEKTWKLFLSVVQKSRANFPLLLRFLKFASETPLDKLLLLQHEILPICSETFGTLHKTHHEVSGFSVLGDLTEMLKRFHEILKFASKYMPHTNPNSNATSSMAPKLSSPTQNQAAAGASASGAACGQIQLDEEFEKQATEVVTNAVREWTNMKAVIGRMLELLNSYIPQEIRKMIIDCIKEIVAVNESESLLIILNDIKKVHMHCRAASTIATSVGPYFPKRGQASNYPYRRIHPPRPMFNMCLQPTQLEASKGVDSAYDQMLLDYYQPYHHMVDRLLRIAFNLGPDIVPPQLLAEVSCLLGYEGVPLHLALFPKLWLDLLKAQTSGKADLQKQLEYFYACPWLKDYIETVLVQEQHSLTNMQIFQFVQVFIDKCQQSAPIPIERIVIAIENAFGSLVDTTNGVDAVIQALDAPNVLTSPGTIARELERLPMSFNRTRGAFRALYILYTPNRLPMALYDGDLRKRFVELWMKFKTVCQDKLASTNSTSSSSSSTTSPSDPDEPQDILLSNIVQCRPSVEDKLRRLYSEFLVDIAEVIGVLLGRLGMPELPVDEETTTAGNDDVDVKATSESMEESKP